MKTWEEMTDEALENIKIIYIDDETLNDMIRTCALEAYGGKKPRTYQQLLSALVDLKEWRALNSVENNND